MYDGQPEVSMCGTVFIRDTTNPTPDGCPQCYDCAYRDVDRMRFEAGQLLGLANEKAVSLHAPAATGVTGA